MTQCTWQAAKQTPTSLNLFPRKTRVIAFAFTFLSALPGQAQQQSNSKIGQLLYESNCLTCHNSQPNWRAHKQANDWDSLTTQVKRWQNNLGMRWDDAQIAQVALYMNRRYFKMSVPADVVK